MFAKTRTSLLAFTCAVALIATACGGSSSGSTDVASTDTTASTSSSSSDDGEPSESPLGDILGIPIGNDEAAEQYFSDLSRQAEVKIAECMLGEGFEYQVIDYSALDGFDSNIDFESREFAEMYGFGIATNPFEESFEAFEAFEDPNQAYLENLTDGEREAYQAALSGELPDFSAGDTQSFEPSGCQGDAYNELFAFGRVFDEFGDEFEELEASYYADQRVVNASSGWSSCIADAGYSYADADGAQAEIQRRYDAIVRNPDAFADPADVRIETESSDGGEEVFLGPQNLNPEFQAQVDELAVEERALGVASWDCNEPLREIEDEVRLEYEQRFVDENGAAIQAALGDG